VFVVVGKDVRKCLVCDEVFTAKQAADHAATPCYLRSESA
jgi:hypothetical protein